MPTEASVPPEEKVTQCSIVTTPPTTTITTISQDTTYVIVVRPPTIVPTFISTLPLRTLTAKREKQKARGQENEDPL